MKWRKVNRIIHRDLGYFFFGMTLIYSISGIALNHIHHWNPNYIIRNEQFSFDTTMVNDDINREARVLEILELIGKKEDYKSHYFPVNDQLKIFIKGGSLVIDQTTGKGVLETIKRRPFFKEINFLHYNNPKKLWTWFSDIFAFSLILIAISGLFLLRGKHGITRRGGWLTLAGVILPIIFLMMYL
jgi:hypothetical protein